MMLHTEAAPLRLDQPHSSVSSLLGLMPSYWTAQFSKEDRKTGRRDTPSNGNFLGTGRATQHCLIPRPSDPSRVREAALAPF